MRTDIIVVGGGIIGCSIALRLARAGLKITVIDSGPVGREASWAAAGMLSPQIEAPGPGPFFDLCMRSRSIYPEWVAEYKETEVLEAPRGKDIDAQMIVDLRRMLRQGGFAPDDQAGFAPDDEAPTTDERGRDHGDGRWGAPF